MDTWAYQNIKYNQKQTSRSFHSNRDKQRMFAVGTRYIIINVLNNISEKILLKTSTNNIF